MKQVVTVGWLREKLAGIHKDAVVVVCVQNFPYVCVIDLKYEPPDHPGEGPGVFLVFPDQESEAMQELEKCGSKG